MDVRRDLHEANRLSWNEATRAHNSHKIDQAAFFRAGGSKLFPEEIALLGDIRGRRLVHLQCNSGQDTLSLVQMGATVTGIDISDEAIQFARTLAQDSGLAATFIRSDVYDWLDDAVARAEQFDVVFCSYGAICWLSDLGSWARGIAGVLRPEGRFVTVEFHPVLWMFETDWSLKYDYFSGGNPWTWDDGISDYVAESGPELSQFGFLEGTKDFRNPHPVHEFQWPVSEIVTALLDAGLSIESFREYPFANGWKGFEGMRVVPGRRAYPPEGMPSLPMMYSLVARKPGHSGDELADSPSS